MKYKVKIITGFRRDQEYSISADEAHKAYYLFLNPEQRGIFSGGLALTGSDIKGVVPDYKGTMGWNEAHNLDTDDWNEIKRIGLDVLLPQLLDAAKDIAMKRDPRLTLSRPLTTLIAEYKALEAPSNNEKL